MTDNSVERTAVIEQKIAALSQTMDKVSEKMDIIHELAMTITKIQEQQIRHSEGLDRAFENIDMLRIDLQKAVKDSEMERADLTKQVSFWRGALLVIGGVLMVAETVLWRGYDDYSNTIQQLKDSAVAIDKRVTVEETIIDKILDKTPGGSKLP